MKQSSILFLQGVIVLIGIAALAAMIRFPLLEGRAENLDLISIYSDPLILYSYAASIPFFLMLYKAYKLLGFIQQNNAFALNSVRALSSIRYCAIVMSISITLAGLYIGIFHDKNDDPAGFLTMCILTSFVSFVFATTVAVFENILQNGVNLKLESEQLMSSQKKI